MHRPEPAPPAVFVIACVGGVVALVWTWAVSSAYLVNTQGPMGEAASWGRPVAALVTAAATWGAFRLVGPVARRAWLAGAAVVVALAVAAWVLAPTVVDDHESFVSVPDRTATCSGWAFLHYPPGQSDGSTVEYCVGVEHPVGS